MFRVTRSLQLSLPGVVHFRNYRTSQCKYKYTDQSFSKSAATLLNEQDDAPLMVDFINTDGFRLNNRLHIMGSLVIFPKSLLSWHVVEAKHINEESLSLFFALEPQIDILVVGKGNREEEIDRTLIPLLRKNGIKAEIHDTEGAIAIYNFLVNEGRFVAGAFIPPRTINFSTDDHVRSQDNIEELWKIDGKHLWSDN